MHYALWDYRTSNIVDTFPTEHEALAVVRDLLTVGWSASELGLALDYDEGEPEDGELPPVLSGAPLAERAAVDRPRQLSA